MGLFKRTSKTPGPPRMTGHAGDDELLRQIALRSPLSTPRHWVHYLYCQDEPAAQAAAVEIEEAGWTIQRSAEAAVGPGWVVIAEQAGVVTSTDTVQRARAFFEDLAARTPGGDYDGWEASL